MAQQAKYTVMIPKVDNLGNPLTDIAAAAHHYLFYGPLKTEGSYIDTNKMGNWRDNDPEPHDLLVTYAEDSPQMDSEIKQLAAYIGDVANQWGIFVIKEGNGGIKTWTVSNPQYREGEPADAVALATGTQPSQAPHLDPVAPLR